MTTTTQAFVIATAAALAAKGLDIKTVDYAAMSKDDLVELHTNLTGTAGEFKNVKEVLAAVTPLMIAARVIIDLPVADGRGVGNRGKKYGKNPAERAEEFIKSLVAEGADTSKIFTHSQVAQAVGVAWMSSVTLLSTLRNDYGMAIHQVSKVNRDEVEGGCIAPEHIHDGKSENGFIWFVKGESQADAYFDEIKAKKDAEKKAAAKLKKDAADAKRTADKAARDAKREADKADREAKRKADANKATTTEGAENTPADVTATA